MMVQGCDLTTAQTAPDLRFCGTELMKLNRTHRLTFAAVSLAFVLFGVDAILHNPVLSYRNFLGDVVFGPFAIIIGGLLFVVFVLNPRRAEELDKRTRRR